MLNVVGKVGKTITKMAGRTGMKIVKASPDILVGVGVVGVVATVVVACKKTKNIEEIATEIEDDIEEVKEKHDDKRSKEYKKDLCKVYFHGGVKLAKHYAPVVALGAASIGCIVGSHYILRKRNVALMAAYKAVDESYKEYRRRVVEKLGEESDRYFKHGTHREEVEIVETDANGKEKKVKKTVPVTEKTNTPSQYAKFYDEGCANWSKDPSTNLHYLIQVQNYCNEILKSRGHIFLNEVYDELGIPRTPAGQIVGWVLGNGDNYVDFGLFDRTSGATRDFVNGYEPVVLLDFNVDGVVWDLI